MRDIWVIAENLPWAAAMITGAKSISADAKIVVFVNGDEAAAKSAVSMGAASAFYLPLPANAMWESYAPALVEKAKADKPALIIVSSSRRGRDVVAQMAALLDAPCFTDGKKASVSGDTWTTDTLVYGGMAVKKNTATAETVLLTMGAKDFEAAPAGSNTGEVGTLALGNNGVTVTERKPKVVTSVNVGEAPILVSVGRGFADQADLEHARELAKALGGEVSCSRPIAEFFKWIPEECYIGISGQQVKPQMYLAIGISGQAQHLYGIRDAKTVVAINKDAEANIMQNADYYIVGTWQEAIPAIRKALGK